MSKFTNVTIKKQANIYYDGSVTSHSIELEDGSEMSLGVMLPGEYTFNTNKAEIMEMLSGNLEVRLPNEEWRTLITPETVNIAANESFDVIVKTVTEYCCSYID